jgi:hypothetical protein
MELKYTPLSIANCEDQLVKLGMGNSFLKLIENFGTDLSIKQILLLVSAGTDNDLDKAGEYVNNWCVENNKSVFEILDHVVSKLGEGHFLDLSKTQEGLVKQAQIQQLSSNTGSKGKKQA